MKDKIEFVQGLKVTYPENPYEKDSNKMFKSAIAEANLPKAFIADKGIVSFTKNTAAEYRQDVLDSILLAQLAANYAYPEKNELENWYDEYMRVLTGIGWIIEKKTFVKKNSNESLFDIENIVLDILRTAIGGKSLAIVKNALDAFKKLSDASNSKIIAFEKNTHTLNEGLFQVGLADQTDNEVSLHIGAFVLSSTEEIRQILFFKSHKNDINLNVYTFAGTLNSNNYGLIRDAVKKKLGVNIFDFLTELELSKGKTAI